MTSISRHLTVRRVIAPLLFLLIAIAVAWLVAQYRAGRRQSEVHAWHPDGGVHQISPSDGFFYMPCVHPDGTDAIYWGSSAGPPRIWQADLRTGAAVALTPPNSAALHGTYSWGGRSIVFASDRDSGRASPGVEELTDARQYQLRSGAAFNLYVMGADGSAARRITEGPFLDERPSFSPDGKQVVFVSNRRGKKNGLWIVGLDGQSPPRSLSLGRPELWGRRPWYSSDGRQVFFFGPRTSGPGHQLYRVPIDGGDAVPLANDDRGISHGPFVDPNGEVLLMHSTRDGEWRLWEVPLDGSAARLIQPPGVPSSTHATRSKDGVLVFDQSRWSNLVLGSPRLTTRLHRLFDDRPSEEGDRRVAVR